MNTTLGFQRILVAMDFSRPALAALEQAVSLAEKSGATIHLAHALPLFQSAAVSDAGPKMDLYFDLLVNEGETLADYEHATKQETYQKLQRLTEALTRHVEINIEVYAGEPYAVLTRAVQRDAHDLVLAGKRGLAPWEQFLVGSTAKRLIRKCPASVWLVKAGQSSPPKAILAATDFSKVSLKGATLGLRLAQSTNAEFHLLHVADSQEVPDAIGKRIPLSSEFQQDVSRQASREMDAFVQSLQADPSSIQVHQSWGVPWQEIRRTAKFLAADLIVMGTVGRSGIRGLLLGNTADKVLDACDCSILTVKPDGFQSPLPS